MTASTVRRPDATGYVERGGVRVFWERYGDGEPTILLVPPWSIVHSRCWKAQIPYLARHYRVLSFDPRGNGGSDRPPEPTAYAEPEFAADALAVLDATETERAVVVTLSLGAQRTLLLAAEHRERVLGVAFIAPFFPASPVRGLRWRIMLNPRLRPLFFIRPPLALGWLKFNAAYWRTDYPRFVDWYMRRVCSTPHSSRQLEDCIEWARETDANTLIPTIGGGLAAPATPKAQTAIARRLRCPVLVISAPDDKVTSHADARALATATGGQLLSVPGGGHTPQARKPVAVNLALRAFVENAFTGDSRPFRGAHTVA